MSLSQRPGQFAVVDLVSQANAVAARVRGWSTDQILDWLREHGTVRSDSTIMDREVYLFSSSAGIDAIFFLNGDRFTFIVDNTTFSPE
jgi:hypothetical protein